MGVDGGEFGESIVGGEDGEVEGVFSNGNCRVRGGGLRSGDDPKGNVGE